MARRPIDDPRSERARVAVAVVFAANGVTFASWVSRTPAIRDALALSPAGLGLLIVSVSAGALLALPASGAIVARFGPARTVRTAASLAAGGLALSAIGIAAGAVVVAAPGFALLGLGGGTWDVAMNVEGAGVERRLGRTLLPRFHAAFSLGTVAGAALGAGCAVAGVAVELQLLGTATATLLVVIFAVRSFVSVAPVTGPRISVTGAWRERRTLLIGVMVVSFCLAEGIANDWLAIAMVDGHGSSDAVGAATFGLFVATMTLARVGADRPLERFGRAPVMRALAVLVVLGALLVALGPSPGWALAGAIVWGLGASLGFPVGLSAAADDELGAAVRVAVVSTFGYSAFLGGPAVVGGLAERFGILDALLIVPLVAVVAFSACGAVRPARGVFFSPGEK